MVRHGDSTTTRGFVIACSSGMFDDGKRIALHGEEATCGNCKGKFKIFGTGTDCTDNGRPTVLHGDPVMCPCGKNKVIAGGAAGCFVESGGLQNGKSAGADSSATWSVSDGPTHADEGLERYFEIVDGKTEAPIEGMTHKLLSDG
jgi:uncharacterized Zn-binding protein involved in type VI secretion